MWNAYHLCEEIDQALEYLKAYEGEARVIAGGTDLMLELELGRVVVPALVDITRIPELQKIAVTQEGFFVGAAVTFSQIIHSDVLRRHAPHLLAAAHTVGGPQIQNVATMVGNIVNASPAADSAPPLYTLCARVHVIDETGREQVTPIEDFVRGVGETALPRCGLVVGISFPALEDGWRFSLRKLGLRRSMAISVVNVALALHVERGTIQEARLALGSVAPTVVRAREAEKALAGASLAAAARSDAPVLARAAVSPIDDFRASAAYRLAMVENLIRAELSRLASTAQKELSHAA